VCSWQRIPQRLWGARLQNAAPRLQVLSPVGVIAAGPQQAQAIVRAETLLYGGMSRDEQCEQGKRARLQLLFRAVFADEVEEQLCAPPQLDKTMIEVMRDEGGKCKADLVNDLSIVRYIYIYIYIYT